MNILSKVLLSLLTAIGFFVGYVIPDIISGTVNQTAIVVPLTAFMSSLISLICWSK